MIFGPAGVSYANFNNFTSLLYDSNDCTNSCGPSAPFADVNLSILANTLYFVQLDSAIYPHQDLQHLTASIDPSFTTTASGGTFLFSPGVFGAGGVPEPASWTMMITGFAALGALARRRKSIRLKVA